MNYQGRCSARQAIVVTALVSLLVQFKTGEAAVFTVGDTSGWSFNVQSWTDGKKFKAGDTLIFNYDRSFHNVAVVGVNEYKSCTSSPSSKTYSSGRDRIKLSKGKNYFICSVPTHCNSGLNIAVDAS
ncbi:hypothetical protein ACOSP7_003420 [Xanthoceras sorbifolium]|uniref:Phytocyanin domain-containing protein n=1 Tax=Xanthoceras sorbifolium TaxID=99658 RepID=A0ABQ8II20_9ROSI|nr:hypothetical protein JRO89_XS01G0038500 [Xanthoceras sorbifolium]